MLALRQVHHIAVIGSDYAASKHFYCDILGFTLLAEYYREERGSWKADLALNGQYVIELFSFPSPPARPSRPEACGLRHLAFSVEDIEASIAHLQAAGSFASRFGSIPIPNLVLPFSAILTDYRSNYMNYECLIC